MSAQPSEERHTNRIILIPSDTYDYTRAGLENRARSRAREARKYLADPDTEHLAEYDPAGFSQDCVGLEGALDTLGTDDLDEIRRAYRAAYTETLHT